MKLRLSIFFYFIYCFEHKTYSQQLICVIKLLCFINTKKSLMPHMLLWLEVNKQDKKNCVLIKTSIFIDFMFEVKISISLIK